MENNRGKKNIPNEHNKLLYDPNWRMNRLGDFSMYQEPVTEEDDEVLDEEIENPSEENPETDNQSIEPNTQSEQVAPKQSNPAVDAAKEAASETIKKGLKKILLALMKNPYFWLVLGGIAVILLIILVIVAYFYDGSNSSSRNYGLYGYEYIEINKICEDITVYDTADGAYDGTYPLEEYVAGVVAAEVGGFNDLTTYEVFAVAARTFALNRLQNSDDCSIAGNATAQAFKKTDNEVILQAVNNTRGLVLTQNGEMFSTMYDAFCYSDKTDNYYTLQAGLQIPVSWAEENVWSWGYLNCKCEERDPSNTACWDSNGNWNDGGHGLGMSQYGTLYLSTQEGYTRDEIFEFFYGDSELRSIYRSIGYDGEYAIYPDDAMYQNLAFLTDISFEEFLTSSGSSLEEFNSYLLDIVETAGVGTREAVVNVAVSLIGSLAKAGYKLPYQWGGKYDAIGARSIWGTEADMSWLCDNYATVYKDRSTCSTNYKWHSFDCSGFVNWALINGFQGKDIVDYQYTDTDSAIDLEANRAVCEPGDVLVNPGHIVLIVGLDNVNKSYIVAESTGSRISTGYGGVKLSYYSYGNSDYKCRSLENYYVESKTTNSNDNIMFVGDSRTVGVCYYNSLCSSSTTCYASSCIAENGKGYSWFTGKITDIKNTSKKNIVINMGVNDLTGNANAVSIANNYFNEYLALAKSLTNKTIYIMSVNPVGDGATVSKSNVESFNTEMKRLIDNSDQKNIKYINAYDNVDFNITSDGLHYDTNTYKAIYEYVLRRV